MLTQEELAKFKSQGFFVLPGFSDSDERQRLRERAWLLVDAFDPGSDSRCCSCDPSLSSNAQRTDSYFVECINKISCFFEAGAFGNDGKNIAILF